MAFFYSQNRRHMIMTLIFNESLSRCVARCYQISGDWQMFQQSFKRVKNVILLTLTCICCKILEHSLVSNINKHLALDSILTDCQHGFCIRSSCKTQLVQFVHDIINNLDGSVNRTQTARFDHNGIHKGV